MNKYVLYMHIFPNNKKYIGITKRKVKDRWVNGNGYKRQTTINNAIKKYGWNNIKHLILEDNLTYKEACDKEKEYIKKYKSNNRNYGYNRSIGGEISALGFKHTQEARKKIKEHNAKYWLGKHRGSDFMRNIATGNTIRKGSKHTEKAKLLNKEKHSIKVYQYDLNDNFLKEWSCIKDAEKYYNISFGSISKVCKGKQKTTGGYKWKYASKEVPYND